MAIYHASFKIVKRSDGKSVVAAAAYRSGKKFYDEREDKVHNYQRKERVLSHKVMLCKNAPAKWKDAERLWNDVEASEKSSRAQLARSCDFALPRELDERERAELIEDYVKRNFVDRGMCAQVDIHTTKGEVNSAFRFVGIIISPDSQIVNCCFDVKMHKFSSHFFTSEISTFELTEY